MNQTISPITVQSSLYKNPQQKPLFSRSVMTSAGPSWSAVDPQATRALVALMDMAAVIGGAASHYGGPAAFAELMSAVHAYMFGQAEKNSQVWSDLFHFVNDAGHCENGLYALKAQYGLAGLNINSLKKFRSIQSGLTGHGEVHCFPEGVFMSNGPLGSAFPQTQGLAMAEKLSGRNRTVICSISDGASMEGEAREAFAAIPGLAQKSLLSPYVLLISDNNTKLSGRIDQESFSMKPTFNSLITLGWEVLEVPDGNDLQACFTAIESAVEKAQAHPSRPVCVWAKTIKGIGTQKTSQSSSGGHGFPLKKASELKEFLSEIYKGQKYPSEFDQWIEEMQTIESQKSQSVVVGDAGEKIQKGISSAMTKAFQQGLPVISITSDLPGSTGVAEFRKAFPQASFDVGVAESNMISVAAGFSKLGYLPVVDTFAQFGVTKGALPLTMAALSEAPMICIFSHTGFQDAADGASHQSLGYLAMLSSIPHVLTYQLSCKDQADALVLQALQEQAAARQAGKVPSTYVFFLGRENFPTNYVPVDSKYDLKKSQIIRNSLSAATSVAAPKGLVIAATGSMLCEAIIAHDALVSKGIPSVVIDPVCMNQTELDQFLACLRQTGGRLLTVDDHQITGGMGALLSHQLLSHGASLKLKSLGVRGEFGQSAYNAIDLYRKHGLDSESIVRAALELI
jgi:transketolase